MDKYIDIDKLNKYYRKIMIDLVNNKDYTRIFEHLRRNVKLTDRSCFDTIGRTNVMNYLRKKFNTNYYYATTIKYEELDTDKMIHDIGTIYWNKNYDKATLGTISIGLYDDYDCEFCDFIYDEYGKIREINFWNDPYVRYSNTYEYEIEYV